MIIGIDPGLSGAIAWVADTGHLVRVADMPTIEINGKKRISAQVLTSMLEEHDDLIKLVALEEPGAMPGQGVSSMFNFGYSCGLIAGVCAGLKLPMAFYRPAVWKRRAGVPADKGAVRQMAQRMFPGCRDFDRVKDDGRAEAALLACWAATKEKAHA
jgi:crossover junction endodeoxyribonuclease RuvC